MKKLCILLALIVLMTCVPMTGCTAEPEPNPATDFEYEIGEDGNITITKYIGQTAAVVIPAQIEEKDVTVIGLGSFMFTQIAITSVVLPDTVIRIDDRAFQFCSQLSRVTLSKNLTTISQLSFSNCTSLIDITLPDSLEIIGDNAFENCTSLKHINIPSNIKEWWETVFAGCRIETVDIAEGVESIPLGAFSGNNILEVVLPSSMREVGMYAFYDCENLKSVTLNEGLTTLGDGAFVNSQIEELIIPSTVVQMTEMVFDHCASLRTVKFCGDAPNDFIYPPDDPPHVPHNVDCTIYYHEGSQGFTSPEWNGYSTEIW
jgi:hypothetical protein